MYDNVESSTSLRSDRVCIAYVDGVYYYSRPVVIK